MLLLPLIPLLKGAYGLYVCESFRLVQFQRRAEEMVSSLVLFPTKYTTLVTTPFFHSNAGRVYL